MRFKSGQEVVCVAEWCSYKRNILTWLTGNRTRVTEPYGPKVGEIVTIWRYSDTKYMYLKEYMQKQNDLTHVFNEQGFEPVMPLTEIQEILQKQPQIHGK